MPDTSRDPVLVAFGRAVRALRLDRGLSQEQLAEASHLHTTYISSIERGHRNVALKNIDRLAQAFDLDLPGLMDAVETAREPVEERR